MRHDAHLHKRNVATLQMLQGHLGALAMTISELIAMNESALAPDESNASASGAPGERRVMLSRDVLAHLRLAGSAGLTSAELVDLVRQYSGGRTNTVRTTLTRFQKKGMVELKGGRWRLTKIAAL